MNCKGEENDEGKGEENNEGEGEENDEGEGEENNEYEGKDEDIFSRGELDSDDKLGAKNIADHKVLDIDTIDIDAMK
ncbi:13570_t:CDS:2 [Racocetra fulgida]|uniref:13570_t:CDS:1 n=1 Tax=Racocetra fulgida TaxID=60492 RepID=A0A9N8WD69_9GLOM|nr:13570_t:CDS:2 [Racocetra fulgida]